MPASSAGSDLEALLQQLNLGKLLPKLLDNDIDSVAELKLCTEEDYKEMEISIGMRRKIMEALGTPGAAAVGASASSSLPDITARDGLPGGGVPVASGGNSAFAFLNSSGGAAGAASQPPTDEALSAALRAAGSTAAAGYASAGHAPTAGYTLPPSELAAATFVPGGGMMRGLNMPSGPEDEAPGKVVPGSKKGKKSGKATEGLTALLRPNDRQGSGY